LNGGVTVTRFQTVGGVATMAKSKSSDTAALSVIRTAAPDICVVMSMSSTIVFRRRSRSPAASVVASCWLPPRQRCVSVNSQ
jgi:hypothetical protein